MVDFGPSGRSVEQVNAALLERGHIRRQPRLPTPYPELGEIALYCVTELHTKDDIDRLVGAPREIVG